MKRLLLLLLMLPAAFAHSDEETVFPAWTYWVEIFEHAAMVLVSVGAVALLLKRKNGNKFAIAGLGVFALAELLTTLHHFLVYTFGVWDSVVNHGLLLVALSLIAYDLASARK